MNLFLNYESIYFGIKMSFLMLENSGYHILKLVQRNWNVFKPMIEKYLLILHSRIFAMKKILLLAIWYYICIRNIR